jgi:hypothetical protein
MNNEVINRENKNIYTNTKKLKDVSPISRDIKIYVLAKNTTKDIFSARH